MMAWLFVDYLHALTMTTIVPELLGYLHLTREHNTMLRKYWLLAHSIHADYNILQNSIDNFFYLQNMTVCTQKIGINDII